jgi:hypothetical protein
MKLKLAARKAESPGVESFIFKPQSRSSGKPDNFPITSSTIPAPMTAVRIAGSPSPPLLAKST